jgi:outer membrane receptor protein involved in Fe transport
VFGILAPPRPALLIALCGLVAAQRALSAEPAATPLTDLPFADLLQTRIESGTKRSEEVRDIPASVTIVTRQEIERYGYVTFEELLKNIPGLFMLDTTGEQLLGSRGPMGGGIQLLVNGVGLHQSRQKGLTMPEGSQYNIPVESIDRIEVIRGPMSIIYGNNAFVGVINVVTNQIDQNGPRTSVSAGTNRSGRLFARAGGASDEGYWVLNAGGYRTDGLEGDYADMMGPGQLAQMSPGMHPSMAGDMTRRDRSLDLSAGWGEWTADIRYGERDYGFYLFSPAFEEGNQADLTTWHAALSWEHRFADNLALRVSGVHSDEEVDVDAFDFLMAELDGFQYQGARRTDLELNLFYDPLPDLNLLAGYRFRVLSNIENRAQVSPGIIDYWRQVDDLSLHDLFAEVGWNASEPLRLVGGLRLSRLPDSYDYTDTDYLTGEESRGSTVPDDRNLLTGRIAALWSLDSHRVIKLIGGPRPRITTISTSPNPKRSKPSRSTISKPAPAGPWPPACFRTTFPASPAPSRRSTRPPENSSKPPTTPGSGAPRDWNWRGSCTRCPISISASAPSGNTPRISKWISSRATPRSCCSSSGPTTARGRSPTGPTPITWGEWRRTGISWPARPPTSSASAMRWRATGTWG